MCHQYVKKCPTTPFHLNANRKLDVSGVHELTFVRCYRHDTPDKFRRRWRSRLQYPVQNILIQLVLPFI